ncbi:MAG: hypothetical protein R6U32_03940 [Candidatus Woesearchaeota archaeon]
MKQFSKKASLNLSIQAIVILIFAVIMLGLGLGLINFIFGAAREKVGGALDEAQLTNPPSADNPLTIERKINIKFKGEQQLQIGFYNKDPDTKHNVEPLITSCKTSDGKRITEESMPTISTVSQDKVEPGGTAGWNAIIKLPNIDVQEGNDGEYAGALVAGQYICKISIYGTDDSDEFVDLQDPADESYLDSTQFFLQVTT